MLAKVDPHLFLEKFGCGLDGAQSLIQAKTLTINKLMTIMPQGTIDPRFPIQALVNSSPKLPLQSVPLQQHHVHHGRPRLLCIHPSLHGKMTLLFPPFP